MYNLKRMKTIRIHKEYMQSLFNCINYYNATNTGKNVLAPKHRIIFLVLSLYRLVMYMLWIIIWHLFTIVDLLELLCCQRNTSAASKSHFDLVHV